MRIYSFILISMSSLFLFFIGLLPMDQNYHALIVSLTFLIIGSFFILLKEVKIKKILFFAFLFRFLAAIISYTEYNFLWLNIFPLEGATTNAVYFHDEAFRIYSNGFLDMLVNFSDYSSNFYSLFISLIYFVFGPYNIIPILINVIFGVLIVYRVFQFSSLLFNNKIAKLSSYFASLSPWMIIFCSTLLREAMVTYFILSSVYLLFKYYKNDKLKYLFYIFLYSVIYILLHGALLILFLMTFMMILLMNRKKINSLSRFSKTFLVFFIPLIFYTMFTFSGITIYKLEAFSNANNISDVLSGFLNRSGEVREISTRLYRDQYKADNIYELILNVPKVLFPFLFKPYPTQLFTWRYPLHYIHSALMYFFIFLLIIKFKSIINNKILKYLLILILVNLIVFAFGTSNINAAIRHNHKFIPLIIVLLSEQIYNFKRRIFN